MIRRACPLYPCAWMCHGTHWINHFSSLAISSGGPRCAHDPGLKYFVFQSEIIVRFVFRESSCVSFVFQIQWYRQVQWLTASRQGMGGRTWQWAQTMQSVTVRFAENGGPRSESTAKIFTMLECWNACHSTRHATRHANFSAYVFVVECIVVYI
jgi:hypothetical protein